MRLLLDAHVSGRAIGRELREIGHDALALDEHRELEGLDDPVVLDLAAQEERILVTFNVWDFPDILREWAAEGRSHTGCIIVVGMAQNEFGPLLRLLANEFVARPDQSGWQNLAVFLSRAPARRPRRDVQQPISRQGSSILDRRDLRSPQARTGRSWQPAASHT